MPEIEPLTLDELRAHAERAIADHSLCVQEGTPDERVLRPSLKWFVEDYLPKVASPPKTASDPSAARAVTPMAAYIEIVEKNRTTDDTPGGSIIVPNEVRINGIPLLCPEGEQVKVHGMTFNDEHGEDVAQVTLTLFARRVVIAAEGDL